MDKLNMQTTNIVDENIKRIGELFPNCLTERLDENGKPETAIDFDQLRQELSKSIVEGPEERYQFTWPDKRNAIRLANAPTTDTLRPCREESVDFDTTQNLYIEGDNLQVLKLLRENYLGKVKMIYIDPPYNTGNDFVYNDDFAQVASEYIHNSGQTDEEGNRLVANTESNGRFHTDWLNMIYPRLKVAKDLLSEDGVIFISIDDNEQENLKKVCDEVFGRLNFVGELIIQTATDNNPTQINTEHEYMLCYAKKASILPYWYRKSDNADKIINYYRKLKRKKLPVEEIQRELREWIKINKSSLKQVEHYNCVDEKGVYTANTNSSNTKPGGYMFDILHPITQKPCPKPAYGWRWTEETFWSYAKEGEVEWGADETTQPHIKKRIETAKEQLKTVIYEDGRSSTILLEELFGMKKIFDNPKSLYLIQRIVDFASNKDSIILDFFSGSATTAHAVMKLNAEDGGSRKFIMVQLPEETNEKGEARKHGFNNICEIGKMRIKRAGEDITLQMRSYIQGWQAANEQMKKDDVKKVKQLSILDQQSEITQEDPSQKKLEILKQRLESLDFGFRVLKLDSSNMQDVYYSPEQFNENLLFEDNIKPDRTEEDLLFQAMIELGIELSAKIEKQELAGKTVWSVANGYLMACFDTDVNETTITEIARQKPYYFVMRDSSLATDNVADNFEQIWEEYSKETIRRII